MSSHFRHLRTASLQSVKLPVMVLFCLACVIFVLLRTGSSDAYEQPPVHLKCSHCGHAEVLTVDRYQHRLNKELPGGAVITKGPRLTCSECDQRQLERVRRDTATRTAPPE